jgi:hypothetical protein
LLDRYKRHLKRCVAKSPSTRDLQKADADQQLVVLVLRGFLIAGPQGNA